MIHVSPEELALVCRILREHVPDCEVRAFGSRVRGCHRPHSDLALVVKGQACLAVLWLGLLREAFRESTLPFRVDVLDSHEIPDSFHAVIDAGYERVVFG